MKKKYIILAFYFVSTILVGQQSFRLMTYNILNYPSKISSTRNPYFKTVVEAVNPDILVVQEMESLAGVNLFYERVLDTSYSIGEFIDGRSSQGYDVTDNALFYKHSKFTFLDNDPIDTQLRDISQFTLVHNASNDTLIIFSAHLKASSGSENEQRRLAEVNILRNITNTLPENTDYFLVGDFNVYTSNEPAYQALVKKDDPGYFLDPISKFGSWHNSSGYRAIHTQSTRTSNLSDDGSTGGLDDRFDFIMISQSVKDEGGITYLEDSYASFGNDANHFNQALITVPNDSVSDEVARALYYSSDHLPVYADFSTEISTSILTDGKVNDQYKLHQNYPNPFNPTTTIKYSIPNVASSFSLRNVTLKVYDVLGKEVATLVNHEQNSGNYEVDFNSEGLSSGIYFYTLKVGEFLDTKKMILVK